MSEETFDGVGTARRLVRTARVGTLATIGAAGAPFASLVTVATLPAGEPVLLLSGLAMHTKNIAADPRVSLLVAETRTDDPADGARVSLSGRLVRIEPEAADYQQARRRFLARQPKAAGYADFADFAFYKLVVEDAYLVAGFGRILTLRADEFLLDMTGADGLVASAPGAVAHMNEDHLDALALYATRYCGQPAGDWLSTGVDPEGMDLMTRDGALSARLVFPERVNDTPQLRGVLVSLARGAREG